MISIGRVLRLLNGHYISPYFSAESYQNILRIAELFPASLSLRYMFERRLDQASAPVDFSILVLDDRHREVLAGAAPGMPSEMFENRAWRSIREFAAAWLEQSEELKSVRALWMEFDAGAPWESVPVPLVFFTLDSVATPMAGLRILMGERFTPAHASAFRRFWESIPPDCVYRTAGIQFPRPTDAIRLIFVTSARSAFQYLDRVRWAGSASGLGRRIARLLPAVGQVAVHVDVHPQGAGPRVGLEIYTSEHALHFGTGGDWAPILERAVQESICSREMRDAIAAWPGSQTSDFGSGAIQVQRRFHHLKLVSDAGSNLQAKAYITADCEVI